MGENREKALLLRDEGYGLAPWLMTPFKNPQIPEERAYNKLFTDIIERKTKAKIPSITAQSSISTKISTKIDYLLFYFT
jgi:hypothetical protein